jgi:hypothetical protein
VCLQFTVLFSSGRTNGFFNLILLCVETDILDCRIYEANSREWNGLLLAYPEVAFRTASHLVILPCDRRCGPVSRNAYRCTYPASMNLSSASICLQCVGPWRACSLVNRMPQPPVYRGPGKGSVSAGKVPGTFNKPTCFIWYRPLRKSGAVSPRSYTRLSWYKVQFYLFHNPECERQLLSSLCSTV